MPTLTGPIAVTGSYNLVFESTKTGYATVPVNMTYIAQLPPIQVLTAGASPTWWRQPGRDSPLCGTYNMINPDGHNRAQQLVAQRQLQREWTGYTFT